MISFGEGIESRAKVIYFTDPEEFFRRNLSRTTSRSPFARGGFCIYCLSQNYFRTFGFLNFHLMDHKKISLFAAASVVAATLWLPSFFSGEKEKPTERRESKTEAIDALQFLSASAAFPNSDIPADGYAKAYEFMNENFAVSKMMETQSVGSWSSIGPRNLGGRTLCVAINPQDTSKVWLGSASGGLWKSNTGGYG